MIKAFESKRKGPAENRSFCKTLTDEGRTIQLGAVLWAEPSEEGLLAMEYLKTRLDQLAEEQKDQLFALPFDRQKALWLDLLLRLDKELSYIGTVRKTLYRAGLSFLFLQDGNYFCIDCEDAHAFLFSQGLLRCISNGADRTMTPFGTGEAHPSPSDGVLPAGAVLLLSAEAFSGPLHRSLEEALADQGKEPEAICAFTEKTTGSKNSLVLLDEEAFL